MTIFNRYLKTALLTVVMCLTLTVTALAAQARINFSDPEVTAGSEVNVSMKITSDDGASLGDATVVLTYPYEKLEFVSGTDADGGAGAIRVHGATNGQGSSVLEYNLKFNTISAGSAVINVDSYEVYDTSDQPLTISHVGSSSVTIKAASDAGSDCTLSTLEVYPGELTPEFSSDAVDYVVSVGTGVDRLTINAIPADSSATVTIAGNEELPDGDSAVTITVNAADGSSTAVYTINVSKVEGGAENVISETEAEGEQTVEGVQLSSKGKTITIINPGDDVEIPEGFKQGTIKIDDQKVQGWVWGADDEPEYCVVYGVNDSGELNFYRYDMVEKTIQRYFEDPIAVGAVSAADYTALEALKDAAEESSNQRFIIICVLAAVIFVMLLVLIALSARIRALSRAKKSGYGGGSAYEQKRRQYELDEDESEADVSDIRKADDNSGRSGKDSTDSYLSGGSTGSVRKAGSGSYSSSGTGASGSRYGSGSSYSTDQSSTDSGDERKDGLRQAEDLLKHEYAAESGADASDQDADETRLIRRSVRRKRRPRHLTQESAPDATESRPDGTGNPDQGQGRTQGQADTPESGSQPGTIDDGDIEDFNI